MAVGVRKGLAPQDGNTLLSAFLDGWLESRRHQVRASTWASQEMIVRHRIVPEIGRLRLVDLTARHVHTLMSRLAERGLAPSSIALTRNILHHAIEAAVRDGALPRNVVDHARPPKREKTTRTWLDVEAGKRYLAASRADPGGPILQATLCLGLRPGEAMGLHWDDYSPERRQLEVRRTAIKRGGAWLEGPPKTASGRRTITIDPALAVVIEAERQRQRDAGQYAAKGPMFLAPDGERFTNDRLTEAHRRILKAAGLPRMRVHDLRHSAASILLEQGVHVRTVAELLGHANVSVTLNTYSHVIARLVDSATSALAGLLNADAAPGAAMPDVATEAADGETLVQQG